MTIAKTISEWLQNFESIKIDLSHVGEGCDQYGLFRSPGRQTKEFNDGSYEITEHYQFFARQSGVSGSERTESDEWLEQLSYFADDYEYQHEYPEVGGNRKIRSIRLSGAPYVTESNANSREILYQMALEIVYVREREMDF